MVTPGRGGVSYERGTPVDAYVDDPSLLSASAKSIDCHQNPKLKTSNSDPRSWDTTPIPWDTILIPSTKTRTPNRQVQTLTQVAGLIAFLHGEEDTKTFFGVLVVPDRCRERMWHIDGQSRPASNMAHRWSQSRPDFGLGSQVRVLELF